MRNSSHAISMLIAKYRAVLRKTWWKNHVAYDLTFLHRRKVACAASILISLAVSSGLAAAGETVTYDGTNPPLQTIGLNNNALGPADLANTTYNNITVNYNNSNVDCVYGGWSAADNVNHNTVSIVNGTVNFYVYGGDSNTGIADNNTVTISGGTVGGACGGVGGTANNNAVTISGGTVSHGAYGGDSTSGAANNNTVTVSGGTVSGDVYGGYIDSGSGAATTNTVTISGSRT